MKRAIFLIVAFFFAAHVLAQDPQTGFPPYGSFEHGRFDAINRQNLNVNFSIPIVSSPGRGQNFSFAIVYDSLIWSKTGTAWSPVSDWGWKKETPAGKVRFLKQLVTCQTGQWPDLFIETAYRYYNYFFTDVGGTAHGFALDFHDQPTSCNFPTWPTEGYATDNSGIFIDASAPENAIIKIPDGKEITGSKLTDTNGNFFTQITISSTETHWKDTVGRITLKIKKPTSTSIEYHVLDPTGGYQVTTMTLTSFSIKTNFGCAGVSEYTGSATLPTSISLPNGPSYSFTYEDTPGWAGYKTGRLKRVTLPTGGFYEYTYPATPNNGINCANGTIKNLTRVINDGASSFTWTFSRAQIGLNWETTITAPQLPYDAAGNQSVFTFDPAGKLLSQKHYQGSTSLLSTVNINWAANGTPASTTVILENNQQSKRETDFDPYGNLLESREFAWGAGAPGGLLRKSTLTYLTSPDYISRNIRNRVTQIIVRDGAGAIQSRTDIAYDETAYSNTECPLGVPQHDDANYGCAFYFRGNPTTTTKYTNPAVPSGAVAKHFSYDFFGNLRKADVECCQQKQWNFSSTTQYAYPDSVVDGPPGGPQLTTNATYNFHTGLIATSTNENNKVASFAYDTLRRLTTITRPDSAQITTTYDDTNLIVTVEMPIQGTDRARQRTEYDQLARPFRQCLLNGSGITISCTDTHYDAVGRPYRLSNPHTGTPAHWTETRFDALGRPTLVIPPDGTQTSNRTVHAYSGNTVTVTDPTGKQRKTETDALGRLVKVYEPDVNNNNSLTQETSYAYSVLDILTQVTQGVQTRTYNYDGMGRLTSAITPEGGSVSYQYNSFSLVTQRTDARGAVTTYSYDTLNRLTQVSYNTAGTTAAATPTVSFAYGNDPNLNNKGRLLSMTDGTGSESYEYHPSMPWTTKVTKGVDGATYVTQYAYNLAGELTSIIYPSGRVVQQNYDAAGRLSQILSGVTTYASQFAYNPAGQVTGLNYGNAVVASFSYSPERLQLTTVSYTKQPQTLFSLTYGYTQNGGNNGQITSITDNVDAGRTVTYTYDALHRLKTAVTNGSAAYPQWGLSWAYDRYGNRTGQTVTAGTAPSNSLTIDPATNRISDIGFGYDASGNMTADGLNSLVYDAENRAVSATSGGVTINYAYDGRSLRVKCWVGTDTRRFVYSGTKVIAEYLNGALDREYIYSGSQLIATHEGSSLKYHHPDHLSTRLNTDAAGTVVRTFAHYPFGEIWYETGATDKWKFTSYERDAESGLDYAMFRYYGNRLGRWMSVDPLAGSADNPQSLNRYPYVLNAPTNLIDLLGLQAGFATILGFDGMWWGPDGGGDVCLLDGAYVSCEFASWQVSMGVAEWASTSDTLDAILRNALTNPACAALVGASNVPPLLNNLNIINATPDNRADILNTYSSVFGAAQLEAALGSVLSGYWYAFTGWSIGSPIITGYRFADQSLRAQATIIIHEFRHQSLQLPDPANYAAEYRNIARACGLDSPN